MLVTVLLSLERPICATVGVPGNCSENENHRWWQICGRGVLIFFCLHHVPAVVDQLALEDKNLIVEVQVVMDQGVLPVERDVHVLPTPPLTIT